MPQHHFALLVHDENQPFDSLRKILREISVETYSVDSCKEARDLILQWKPDIVFTASSMADGTWETILKTVERIDLPLGVIVVGEVPDVQLYRTAREHGAFDFITPPFEPEALKLVVQAATRQNHTRGEVPARSQSS